MYDIQKYEGINNLKWEKLWLKTLAYTVVDILHNGHKTPSCIYC